MILGIDIGGQTIKIGEVRNKKILQMFTLPTRKNKIIFDIVNFLQMNFSNLKAIEAIGFSIPGFLNHETGVIIRSGNLNWNNFNFQKKFFEKIQTPSFLINDANAAALGEYGIWNEKLKWKSLIFYTLGTGVGGGIIINGQLVFGAHGFAGELGHGGYFQNEEKCSCGLNNCLEPSSSAKGIEKALKKHFKKEVSIRDIKNDFLNKNNEIIKIFKKSLRPLARHIIIMQNAINPNAIIIGGGPSNLGQPLADLIADLVKEEQLSFVSEKTPIKIAITRNNAGILGAAYWALQKLNLDNIKKGT